MTWDEWLQTQQADEQENAGECIPVQECDCPPLDEWRHGV